MAIAYKSAGSGASTETSGAALSPTCPATVDAGDVLIAHVFWEGTTTAPSTPSNWTLLSGPHVIETTIARHWVFGKVADGTEDGAAVAFGNPAVTTQRAARVYSFSGRVSGDISLLCQGFSHQSHATDPQMPTVTTVRAGALAVALVAQNDNNATGDATGESGGDWTEAVAEYTVALTPGFTLQIQTCTPTSNPGTVSGGSVATTNDPCGVIGFYIQDVAETPKAATDSLLAGLTDSAAVYFREVVSSDTVSGFDDDWRKLTDSDTFTYHNRIESVQVRLNGAGAQVPDTASVSASDSLTAGLTDTFTGSQAFAVTDSCAVQATDTSNISSSVSCNDSTKAQASEASTVQNTFSVTDSSAIGAADSVTSLAAVLTVTDSTAAQASEIVTTLASSAVCSDTLTEGLADAFTGSQTVSSVDSCAVQLAGGTSIAASLSVTESCAVRLSEDAAISQATVSATDSVAVQVSETANVIQNVLVAVTDSCAVQASDDAGVVQNTMISATDSLVAQAGETSSIGATVSAEDSSELSFSELLAMFQALTVSDACVNTVSEDQFSSLPTVASEGVATSLSDAASVGVVFSSIDDLIVQLEEAASKQAADDAVPKSAQDSCTAQLKEGAVTEYAGPYWSSVETEEHGLVYADSYAVGRRENPGRTRW